MCWAVSWRVALEHGARQPLRHLPLCRCLGPYRANSDGLALPSRFELMLATVAGFLDPDVRAVAWKVARALLGYR